jgi:hypothetical protein
MVRLIRPSAGLKPRIGAPIREIQGVGEEVVLLNAPETITKKNQPTLATKPTMPSTRPTIASVPPPTAPPLIAIRWREMKPMMAAVGPRMIPRHPIEQTIEMIPMTRDAIARPSVRWAAYPP